MRPYTIRITILAGVLLRIFVAIWNGFYGPSPGADLDALGFNGLASAVATTGDLDEFYIGYTPYTNLLGIFYGLTYNHIFIGSLLSCLTWWLSAYILCQSFNLLCVDERQIYKAMLIYALLPSSIFMTSITIREPYQLFFVNLAIYSTLNIYLQKTVRHWAALIIAIAGAGSLHGALLFFGILLFTGTLMLVAMRGKKRISWTKLVLMGISAAVILWYGFSLFSNYSYDLNEGLEGAIGAYQQDLLSVDARTHYKSYGDLSGVGSMFLFIPVGLFQYMFEPFPWHISASSDGVSLLENILRGYLILKAWRAVRTAPAQKSRVLFFVFLSYLVMETIWSVGTVNWGTSIRHHIPAFGLLLLAAYAVSDRKIRTHKITRSFHQKINSAVV